MLMSRRSRLSRGTEHLTRPLRKANKIVRRNPGWAIAGVAVLALGAVFVYFYPELRRYIHMERM